MVQPRLRTTIGGGATHSPEHPRAAHWRDQASCAGIDTEAFFPDDRSGQMSTTLARVCFDCPVKMECRLAGYGEGWGFFGNVSAHERADKRYKIFGRVFPGLTWNDEDHDGLRRKLSNMLKSGDSVGRILRKAGLNGEEIALFFSLSSMDRRAMKSIKTQEYQRTTALWRRTQGRLHEDPQSRASTG